MVEEDDPATNSWSHGASLPNDRLSRWGTDIAQRSHPNVAAVALANKTARVAWAMLRHKTDYDPALAAR
jgi:transposase